MNNPVNHSKDSVFLLILCSLAVLSWAPRLEGPIDMRFDGGSYYILGTSLAQGTGYRLLNEPGEIQSMLHPPLLPAFVAVHQRLLGTSDPMIVGRWLRLSFFVLFVIYILAAYLMLRLYLTPACAFLAAVICLSHINTLFLSDLLFADLLFALTTTLFFVLHKRIGEKGYSIPAILFAFASYGLRTVGAAVLAAWAGECLFNKDFKKALLRLTISSIPIVCWQSYIYSVGSAPQHQRDAYEYQRADYMYSNVSYARNASLVDSFAPEKGYVTPVGRITRFARNVLRMPADLGEAVSGKQGFSERHLTQISNSLKLSVPHWAISWSVFFALLILGFLVIGGLILQVTKRQWFTPLYVSIYLAMMCLTPWPGQFGRYLMPLAPFLVLSLFETLLFIKAKSREFLCAKWKIAGHVFAAAVLSLILVQGIFTVYAMYRHYHLPVAFNDKRGGRVEYQQFFYSKPYRSLDEALDWLMAQGKPGDVVAGAWPHWMYLRTGLKAVLPPFELDADRAQHLLDTVPVKYLLLEKDDFLGTQRYVSPVIQNARGRWELVFSTPDGDLEIYERAGE